MSTPETGFTQSGSITITYQVAGSGVPVIFVPGFISHGEFNWESPSSPSRPESTHTP